MTRALAVVISSIVLLACLGEEQTLRAAAQEPNAALVFRIGAFDRSSIEFASGNPKAPVKFLVGQSDPSKDWYQTQPAVLSSALGANAVDMAAAPRTIVFSIPSETASYKLHLSFLIESASVPALRVDVNGKHGLFYLHPELEYSNGDQGDSFYPAYSHADLEFWIPAGLLRQGENSIALQAVEEADRQVPDAGLTYDAIELDRAPAGRDSPLLSAEIRPTIFFQQQNSALQEIIDAFIHFERPLGQGGIAELTIEGKKYEKPLSGDEDFGEEKLEFQVAEFPAKTQARLVWNANGHPEHLEQSIDPKKKWTLLLVPHIHVDVGYSDSS